MKKKHIIIPIACGLLAIVLGLLIVFYTTPVSYEIHSEKFNEIYGATEVGQEFHPENADWFYMAKKCGKTMNIAYKINPSGNNLLACGDVYSVFNYKNGIYYSQTAPDDYLDYCVKYSKALYESPNSGAESFAVPVGFDAEKNHKINYGIRYALALYLKGDIEASKGIAQESIDLIDADCWVTCLTFKDYFYYVYATSQDEALKAWILEKEAYLEQLARDTHKYDGYFEKHESLYTNPDLDTVIRGGWPEYSES